MNTDDVPERELSTFRESVKNKSEYLDTTHVQKAYRKLGLKVIEDPFDYQTVALIKAAIKDKKPYSVIRMGDGEINLLTYPYYEKTPVLNRIVAHESVNKRMHSFIPNEQQLHELADLMKQALFDADLVGALGLWRPKNPSLSGFLNNTNFGLRGMTGQWRGIEYLLKLANQGLFDNKVIVSAHCYFAVIQHIDDLLKEVNAVWLISSEKEAINKLIAKHQNIRFHVVSLPKSERPLTAIKPEFLFQTKALLPAAMDGSLALIGAGPWAEIYAYWIKQRGGVSVDVGSGFDLLAGRTSRPVHRKVLDMGQSSIDY